jgi:hypothetical protein
MSSLKLKEFCSKSSVLTNELVRCGSCGNSLLHCGKYELVHVNNNKDNEGLLCETCKKNNRDLEMVTRISEDNNHVFQVPISQLDIRSSSTIKKASSKESHE